MKKIVKILMLAAIAAIIPGLMITGCSPSSTTAKAIVGQKAPDFTLTSINGESVSLSDLEGQPVLVNFWRINCAPCIDELPYLQAVHNEQGDNLVILGINTGESSSTVKQFAQDNGLSFEILLDSSVEVAQKYNIPGTPTTFFIDKDGIIRAKVIGAFPSKAAIDTRLTEVIS